jgi:hypothetical protein
MKMFDKALLDSLAGSRVRSPGHFEGQVVIESSCARGYGVDLRVRLAGGHLDEVVPSSPCVAGLLEARSGKPEVLRPANANWLRLMAESVWVRGW